MRKQLLCGLALGLLFSGGEARAQGAIGLTEELDFDRPESWAMKYFASLGLLTGMGVPEAMAGGAIRLGFEAGLVPQLSEEQRRVGFNGTKLEEVNKSRLFGRLRAAVGLSGSFSLDLAYTPPVEIGGARPHLFAVGIGRSFALSPSWQLGVRSYGQLGTIGGDITCSADEAAAGPDRELNPFLCEEPSTDSLKQRLVGAEVSTGYETGRWRPYAGVGVSYMDLEFQVDARYSGIVDRILQLTDGVTLSVTTGLAFAPSPRWLLSAELFYSWLSVTRPPSTSSQNDGLLNGRFLVTYQIR